MMGKPKIVLINVICIAFLALFFLLAWNYLVTTTPRYDSDYATFYHALHDNDGVYKTYHYLKITESKWVNQKLVITTNKIDSLNINTPLMSLFLKGVVNVSHLFVVNAFVWIAVSFLFAGISAYFLVRFLDDRAIYFFIPAFFLLWINSYSIYTLKLAQVSFIVLLPLSLSFFLLSQKKTYIFAVLAALCASLKLFFLIFLLFFAIEKCWKLLCVFIVFFLLFSLLPLCYFSLHDFYDFLQVVANQKFLIDRGNMWNNGSIFSIIFYIFNALHIEVTHAKLTSTMVLSSLLLLGLWIIYDQHYVQELREFKREIRFSFLVVFALLCSPLGWAYYFIFLFIPLALLLKIGQKYNYPNYFYIFLMAAFLLPCYPWLKYLPGIFGKISYFVCFGSLCCWVFCLIVSVNAIRLGERKSVNQFSSIVGVVVLNLIITIMLLSFNCGAPYFLSWDKEAYGKLSPVGYWIHENDNG